MARSLGRDRHSVIEVKNWIPACAGMSGRGQVVHLFSAHPRESGGPEWGGCVCFPPMPAKARIESKSRSRSFCWIPDCAGMSGRGQVVHLFSAHPRESGGPEQLCLLVFYCCIPLAREYADQCIDRTTYSRESSTAPVNEHSAAKVIAAFTACETSHCQRNSSQLAGTCVQLLVT